MMIPARGKKKKLALIIPFLTLLAVMKMKLLLIPILLSVLLLKKLALIAALLLPSLFSTLKACKVGKVLHTIYILFAVNSSN